MRNVVVMGVALCLLVAGAVVGQDKAAALGGSAAGSAEAVFTELYDAYLARYEPLYRASRLTKWEANVSGTDEAFARSEATGGKLVELHSDRKMLAKLKALKGADEIRDPVCRRQLDVMVRKFLRSQADPAVQKRIVVIEGELEQVFNVHRGEVDGKALTENAIRKILSESKDSTQVEKAWRAYMQVGAKVEKKLREVVRLRNQVARELGFRDFYAMNLALNEIDEGELLTLFDELDALTKAPFATLKREIDEAMAARFGVPTAELRPWHYGDLFFQEAPTTEAVDLDVIYEDQDLLALAKTYYDGLGLDVHDILRRSDLYEKPGKSPHAFAADLDRAGDVRILCNLKPNLYWMDTLLHELGHAVYDEYIDPELPFILRKPSHSITTEGIAMMLGAIAQNPEYLVKVVKLPPDRAEDIVQAARRGLRAEKLIFSRWSQVMTRFERGMYADPDQDLGKLWWDLKREYQLQNPPPNVSRPDYAAKNHIVTTPAYYHSYMMGDLFACQVQAHIARKVLGVDDPCATSFHGSKEAGQYMKEHIFRSGNLYSWNDLTRRATGEPLSAKFFAQQYVNRAP